MGLRRLSKLGRAQLKLFSLGGSLVELSLATYRVRFGKWFVKRSNATDSCLTDSWPTPAWWTPDQLLTMSTWPIHNGLLTDSKKLILKVFNLESLTNELSKLGAHFKRSFGETEIDFKVSIWRAGTMSSPNLESCPNELSKFGEPSQWALQIWKSSWKFIWGNLDPPWTPQTSRRPQKWKALKKGSPNMILLFVYIL